MSRAQGGGGSGLPSHNASVAAPGPRRQGPCRRAAPCLAPPRPAPRLRLSLAFWHTMRSDGADVFGAPTRRWAWEDAGGGLGEVRGWRGHGGTGPGAGGVAGGGGGGAPCTPFYCSLQ